MRFRTRLAALAVAAVAATGSAAAMVPAATAAPVRPAAPADLTLNPENICLTSACAFRWHSNGSGTQVTISNNGADYSTINPVNQGTGGGTITLQFQNGNGKCFYVNGAQQLVTGSNGCTSSFTYQRFYEYSYPDGSCCELESVRYVQTFAFVYGTTTGDKVWVKPSPLPAGSWSKWNGVQR